MYKKFATLFIAIKKFIWDDLWSVPNGVKSPFTRFVFKQLKIIFITIKGFMEDNVIIRASALTYYSLLSVIPVVAMAFGIAKGFGFEKLLRAEIKSKLQGQKEVFDWVTTMANRMLEHTKGELIASVGLIILIWSVMRVMGFVERSFNDIWQIKKGRSFNRKLTDYFAIILISPIFFVLSSSVTVYIATHFNTISQSMKLIGFFGPFIHFFINLSPYILIWVLFTIIYMAIPNTKVKFNSALIAGIVAGTMFQIVQLFYFKFQIYVSNYNAVYGSFAALPLFMIWMQTAWLIVLFGAELSFASQNFGKYEFERVFLKLSIKSRRALYLLVTSFLCKRFANGEKPSSLEEISISLDMPQTICKEIVTKLNEIGILSEVNNSTGFNTYQPAMDIHLISVSMVISKLESFGIDNEYLKNNTNYQKINQLIMQYENIQSNSDTNILLKEL